MSRPTPAPGPRTPIPARSLSARPRGMGGHPTRRTLGMACRTRRRHPNGARLATAGHAVLGRRIRSDLQRRVPAHSGQQAPGRVRPAGGAMLAGGLANPGTGPSQHSGRPSFRAVRATIAVHRSARLSRETYWTYSYSPITDAGGRVLGVFGQTTDTGTAEILGERRLGTLRDLGDVPSTSTADPADACRLMLDALARNRADIPFCAVYLVQHDEPALVCVPRIRARCSAAARPGHRPAGDDPAADGGGHRTSTAGHRHPDPIPWRHRRRGHPGRRACGCGVDRAAHRARPVPAGRRDRAGDQPVPGVRR